MTKIDVLRFSDLHPTTQETHPDPTLRVTGNPKRTTSEYFGNAAHGVRSGTWKSEVGAYRIAYPDTKHEFFRIISGRVQVQADGCEPVKFGPNDSGVLRPGFRGIFEILEPASKFFVVVEQAHTEKL